MQTPSTEFNLSPYGSQKSFYGKAKVIQTPTTFSLKSYETIVAVFNRDTEKLIINGYYSATTAKHINSFLSYLLFGYRMNKKQILEAVGEELPRPKDRYTL